MVQEVVGSNPISHPKRNNLCRCLRGASPHCTPTALYPSGLRGESAKLLFASSNLAEASMKEKTETRLLIIGLLLGVVFYAAIIFGVKETKMTFFQVPQHFTGFKISFWEVGVVGGLGQL